METRPPFFPFQSPQPNLLQLLQKADQSIPMLFKLALVFFVHHDDETTISVCRRLARLSPRLRAPTNRVVNFRI